jgi:hypothetical protein
MSDPLNKEVNFLGKNNVCGQATKKLVLLRERSDRKGQPAPESQFGN